MSWWKPEGDGGNGTPQKMSRHLLTNVTTFLGGKNACPQKTGLAKVPQNSAELFCRKVLQNVAHSKEPIEARFCTTPKFCRALRAKPRFSCPAKPSPIFVIKCYMQHVINVMRRHKKGGKLFYLRLELVFAYS